MTMLSIALLAMAFAGVSAQTCQNIAGNYYCDQTKLVQFENVGFNGQYNRVTSFNNDGTCSSAPQSFSGSLAPFNEELSVHFRGPIQLENFKVFTSGSTSGAPLQKRGSPELHHRHAEPEPVMVTATEYYTAYVTAGADSPQPSVQTSVETHSQAPVQAAAQTSSSAAAPAAPAAPQSSSQSAAAPAPAQTTSSQAPPAPASSSASTPPVYNYNYNHEDQTSQTGPSIITRTTSSDPVPSSSTSAPTPTGGSGSWSQAASYNAGAASADGLVFLNNLGGGGSGVFDFQFGNSLSYAGSDGVSCASSPQVLSQTLVGSNKEFVIFSDSECQNGDCGYYRPGNVAYHGFGGANKVFVFEFSMPSVGGSGFNADMPAVWLLNAQIPRNLQYGPESCSCWSSGCGELDLWEVLNTGNDRLTTTLHDKQNGGGGTADYFQRPTQGTLKGAAIFQGTTVTVVEIPEIPDSIDDSTIESWISQAGKVSTVNM